MRVKSSQIKGKIVIIDSSLLLADNVAISKSNSISKLGDDLLLTDLSRFGDGKPLFVCIQISTTVTSAGSSLHLRFHLAATDSPSTTPSDSNSINCTRKYLSRSLVVGTQFTIPLSPGVIYSEYLHLQTEPVGVVSGGALTAFLTYNQPASYYPGKEAPD